MLAVLTAAAAVLLNQPVKPIVSAGSVDFDAAAVAVAARARYSSTWCSRCPTAEYAFGHSALIVFALEVVAVVAGGWRREESLHES